VAHRQHRDQRRSAARGRPRGPARSRRPYETGWSPKLIHHVAGAFRYTSYDFLKRWAMKYIAYRKGAPTDTSRDYELTVGGSCAVCRLVLGGVGTRTSSGRLIRGLLGPLSGITVQSVYARTWPYLATALQNCMSGSEQVRPGWRMTGSYRLYSFALGAMRLTIVDSISPTCCLSRCRVLYKE
jgi:hypothetical protein